MWTILKTSSIKKDNYKLYKTKEPEFFLTTVLRKVVLIYLHIPQLADPNFWIRRHVNYASKQGIKNVPKCKITHSNAD